MKRLFKTAPLVCAAALALLVSARPAAAQTTLGTFTFDDNLFGDTLIQSDGGTFANHNWLNTVNANPGSPGYLTGANFNTGIANIGVGGAPVYTIGYNTPILNDLGADLAIVSARFSADTFDLAVSTDGVNFTSTQSFAPATAVNTGVGRTYYYNGNGPFSSTLFATGVDLSAFGIAQGASISAVRITGLPEADLIRVAGFRAATSAVPEPSSALLFLPGLAAFGLLKLRKKKVSETEEMPAA